MTIPAWLLRQLIADGHLDENGVGRTARGRRHDCGALVLVGLDADRCAGVATVDPSPIDLVGECLALLAGRSTYDLCGSQRLELDHRYDARIRGPRRYPVVAEHRCGLPPLPSDPDPPTLMRRQPDTDTPPF